MVRRRRRLVDGPRRDRSPAVESCRRWPVAAGVVRRARSRRSGADGRGRPADRVGRVLVPRVRSAVGAARERAARGGGRDRRRRGDRGPLGHAARSPAGGRAAGTDPVAGARRHLRASARLRPADARAEPALGDPRRMSILARTQERELRSWLYGRTRPADHTSVSGAINGLVEQIEREHAITVEAVSVGDAQIDDEARALLAAAREALVNAARHSGASTASLFLEIEPERMTAYVRDRGGGFDRASVGRIDAASLTRSRDGSRASGDAPRSRARPAPARSPSERSEVNGVSDAAVRVFVVDDHRLFLSGVRSELGRAFAIVGDAESVDAAIEGSFGHHPTWSSWTFTCPTVGAPRSSKGCARAKGQGPRDLGVRCRGGRDRHHPRAGARGYVTKTIAARRARRRGSEDPRWRRRVLAAPRGVRARRVRRIASAGGPRSRCRATDAARTGGPPADRPRLLLPRTSPGELFISIKTVESHVSSVLRKLQLSSRHELSRWAADRRLV